MPDKIAVFILIIQTERGKKSTSNCLILPNERKKKATVASFNLQGPANYFNLIAVFLYLLIDFIPKGDAIDYNGPQWLYLGILNLVVIFYLYSTAKTARTGLMYSLKKSFSEHR